LDDTNFNPEARFVKVFFPVEIIS